MNEMINSPLNLLNRSSKKIANGALSDFHTFSVVNVALKDNASSVHCDHCDDRGTEE